MMTTESEPGVVVAGFVDGGISVALPVSLRTAERFRACRVKLWVRQSDLLALIFEKLPPGCKPDEPHVIAALKAIEQEYGLDTVQLPAKKT